MRELVDSVHRYMWDFAEQAGIDIDPVALRRGIQRQLNSACLVLAPAALDRMGPQKLALMIDIAGRYNLTLAELFQESVDDGVQRAHTLANSIYRRKDGIKREKQRPKLRLVQ